MSWKTNPIANRFSQSIGWKNEQPFLSTQQRLRLTNIISIKNLSFITQWLKYNRWYLLNFKQTLVNGKELYDIIALRMPKVKLRRKSGIKKKRLCKLRLNSPENIVDYSCIFKKISITKKHFKKRKKLFTFYKNLKTNNFSIQNAAKTHFELMPNLLLQQNKLKNKLKITWVKFLANYADVKKNNFINQFKNKYLIINKQLSVFLKHSNLNVYSNYDLLFQEWKKPTFLKKRFTWKLMSLPYSKQKLTLKYWKIKYKAKQLNPNLKFLVSPMYLASRKNRCAYRKVYIKTCNLYFKLAKKKLKRHSAFKRIYREMRYQPYYTRKLRLFKIWRYKKRKFLKIKRMQLMIKHKTKFIRKKKGTNSNVKNKKKVKKKKITKKSKKHSKVVLRKKRKNYYVKKIQIRLYKKKLRIYKTLNKTLLRENRRYVHLRLHSLWRIKYLRIKCIKDNTIRHFLKLVRLFKKLRKPVLRISKPYFMTRRRIKRRVLRHSWAHNMRKKWQQERQRLFNMKRHIIPNWKEKINQQQGVNFGLAWHICASRNRKKKRKIKFRLRKYRLNFLFKNVLCKILKIKNVGTATVRFLQPIRFFISFKKLRKIVRKNWTISRFRKQRVYKRILPYLALLFRYWNSQPLIEQIAFEMEKTKKHWPLLRIVRTLIQKLKPKFYTGYRITIRGKISSSKRTRVFNIKWGKLPINTFQNRMTFAFYQSNARIGSFGIKSWNYFTA